MRGLPRSAWYRCDEPCVGRSRPSGAAGCRAGKLELVVGRSVVVTRAGGEPRGYLRHVGPSASDAVDEHLDPRGVGLTTVSFSGRMASVLGGVMLRRRARRWRGRRRRVGRRESAQHPDISFQRHPHREFRRNFPWSG